MKTLPGSPAEGFRAFGSSLLVFLASASWSLRALPMCTAHPASCLPRAPALVHRTFGVGHGTGDVGLHPPLVHRAIGVGHGTGDVTPRPALLHRTPRLLLAPHPALTHPALHCYLVLNRGPDKLLPCCETQGDHSVASSQRILVACQSQPATDRQVWVWQHLEETKVRTYSRHRVGC